MILKSVKDKIFQINNRYKPGLTNLYCCKMIFEYFLPCVCNYSCGSIVSRTLYIACFVKKSFQRINSHFTTIRSGQSYQQLFRFSFPRPLHLFYHPLLSQPSISASINKKQSQQILWIIHNTNFSDHNQHIPWK